MHHNLIHGKDKMNNFKSLPMYSYAYEVVFINDLVDSYFDK